MNLGEEVRRIAAEAEEAAFTVASLGMAEKKRLLLHMADALEGETSAILEANAGDLTRAGEADVAPAMLDRLRLDEGRVRAMAAGLRDVAALPDPVGEISGITTRPNGLRVGKMRIPLGVVGIIYEARPNVTSDAAGLCLKAGNAVVLKGGSEAIASNEAIVRVLQKALSDEGLPVGAVSFIPFVDREAVLELLRREESIDLIIPRGGEGLIRFVAGNSRIPVIKHYKGVCHVYVDRAADLDMALRIAFNAKIQRPGVCNSLETLLVHRETAAAFLPDMAKGMRRAGVELRLCPQSMMVLGGASDGYRKASEEDYHSEFLDLILAVKVVGSLEEAVRHIRRYGSDHTESIVTGDLSASRRFMRLVNSSVVMVNASTRFSDGGELGLGAEIGISTTKLHAYGPMGARELTTEKFIVIGDGQVRG